MRQFLILYEPGWHGWAVWIIEEHTQHPELEGFMLINEIARGRWRPPRDWEYRKVEIT